VRERGREREIEGERLREVSSYNISEGNPFTRLIFENVPSHWN